MNARVLKFHIQIPHEKIVDPYFFSCPSYAPFLSYVPLKTKFENLFFSCSKYVPFWSYAPFKTKSENLVCKISQKVFKVEPSYLVYWFGLRRRSPDKLFRTFRQILTK